MIKKLVTCAEIVKFQLKCDCIDRSVVNGSRQVF